MAGSFNKVILLGNLTRDPEVRHTSSNQAVCKFGLATNRRFKSADGELREEVTFVDCEAWGRTAEVIGQYLKKGRPVFIEGRLRLDQWEDKNDGSKRSRLLVVVESFQFVDSRGGDEGGGGQGGGQGGSYCTPRSSPAGARTGGRAAPQGDDVPPDDDIPF